MEDYTHCPECGIKMKHKEKYIPDVNIFGPEPDNESYIRIDKYKCDECHISYDGEEWNVPKKLRPTEKQKSTILFINHHLGMDLEAVTKHQAWREISQYFDQAKKQAGKQTKETGNDEEGYDDREDLYDYFDEYF